MSFGTGCLLFLCLFGMSIARPSEPRTNLLQCKEDSDCKEGSYCLSKLNQSRCSSCHSCQTQYNRQNSSQNMCVKNWKDCGRCLPGFDEETLTGNKIRDRCIPPLSTHSERVTQGTTPDNVIVSPKEDQQVFDGHVVSGIISGVFIILAVLICLRHIWKKLENRKNKNEVGTTDEASFRSLISGSNRESPPNYEDTEFTPIKVPEEVRNNATPFNIQAHNNNLPAAADFNPVESGYEEHDEQVLRLQGDPGSPTGSQVSSATEPSIWEPTLDSSSEYEDQNNIPNSWSEVNDSGFQADAETTMISIEGSQNSGPSTTSQIGSPHADSSPTPSVRSDVETVVDPRDDPSKAVIGFSPTQVPQRSFSIAELSSNSTSDALPSTTTSATATATARRPTRLKRSIGHQQDQEQPAKKWKSNDFKEN